MERTCLRRFLGDCKKRCEVDYKPITPEHPLNNLSCKNYYELHYFIVTVVDPEERKYGESNISAEEEDLLQETLAIKRK